MYIEQFFKTFSDVSDVEYNQETTSEGIILRIYIAGVKKSDINVYTKSNILYVEANGRVGFNNWKHKNSWRLSEIVDLEKISSSYIDGVLSINIPLVKESNDRKINIA